MYVTSSLEKFRSLWKDQAKRELAPAFFAPVPSGRVGMAHYVLTECVKHNLTAHPNDVARNTWLNLRDWYHTSAAALRALANEVLRPADRAATISSVVKDILATHQVASSGFDRGPFQEINEFSTSFVNWATAPPGAISEWALLQTRSQARKKQGKYQGPRVGPFTSVESDIEDPLNKVIESISDWSTVGQSYAILSLFLDPNGWLELGLGDTDGPLGDKGIAVDLWKQAVRLSTFCHFMANSNLILKTRITLNQLRLFVSMLGHDPILEPNKLIITDLERRLGAREIQPEIGLLRAIEEWNPALNIDGTFYTEILAADKLVPEVTYTEASTSIEKIAKLSDRAIGVSRIPYRQRFLPRQTPVAPELLQTGAAAQTVQMLIDAARQHYEVAIAADGIYLSVDRTALLNENELGDFPVPSVNTRPGVAARLAIVGETVNSYDTSPRGEVYYPSTLTRTIIRRHLIDETWGTDELAEVPELLEPQIVVSGSMSEALSRTIPPEVSMRGALPDDIGNGVLIPRPSEQSTASAVYSIIQTLTGINGRGLTESLSEGLDHPREIDACSGIILFARLAAVPGATETEPGANAEATGEASEESSAFKVYPVPELDPESKDVLFIPVFGYGMPYGVTYKEAWEYLTSPEEQVLVGRNLVARVIRRLPTPTNEYGYTTGSIGELLPFCLGHVDSDLIPVHNRDFVVTNYMANNVLVTAPNVRQHISHVFDVFTVRPTLRQIFGKFEEVVIDRVQSWLLEAEWQGIKPRPGARWLALPTLTKSAKRLARSSEEASAGPNPDRLKESLSQAAKDAQDVTDKERSQRIDESVTPPDSDQANLDLEQRPSGSD